MSVEWSEKATYVTTFMYYWSFNSHWLLPAMKSLKFKGKRKTHDNFLICLLPSQNQRKILTFMPSETKLLLFSARRGSLTM